MVPSTLISTAPAESGEEQTGAGDSRALVLVKGGEPAKAEQLALADGAQVALCSVRFHDECWHKLTGSTPVPSKLSK